MLKRNWQIWFAFFTALTVAVLAMSWVSWQAIGLDTQRETNRAETELARLEAELQERISSALYRLDLMMLPVVAGEASRPHESYQALNSIAEVSSPDAPVILPEILDPKNASLLAWLQNPAPYVLLHFQVKSNNEFTSPEIPTSNEAKMVMQQIGINPSAIQIANGYLNQAKQIFSFQSLVERCAPKDFDPLQAIRSPEVAAAIYNVPAVERFQAQMETELFQKNQIGEQEQAGNILDLQRYRGNQRINDEFSRRRNSTQQFTGQNSYANGIGMGYYGRELEPQNMNPIQTDTSTANFPPSLFASDVRYGVMQPVWFDDQLLLARRVEQRGDLVIQVCWLDWESIQAALRSEVETLLPDVQFQPLTSDTDLRIGTALTTIPVQLVVDSQKVLASLAFGQLHQNNSPTSVSGMTLALVSAWIGLALAAAAAAGLLLGVMRLSERRAAFVSSVTHELRTPLTTFRMYAEMLAEEMVPDDKRQSYANTLKIQADRLSHLVENVLQFARLERHPQSLNRENVNVPELFERMGDRLQARARDAGFECLLQNEVPADVSMSTQVATVEQILFNLVDNACKYARPATGQQIEVQVSRHGGMVQFRVRDYGPGIAKADRKKLFQPFQQSVKATANQTGGVGLGLALCRRMAESLGGKLYHEPCSEGALFVFDLPAYSAQVFGVS